MSIAIAQWQSVSGEADHRRRFQTRSMIRTRHAVGCISFAFPWLSVSRRLLGFPESSNPREAKGNPSESQRKAIASETSHSTPLRRHQVGLRHWTQAAEAFPLIQFRVASSFQLTPSQKSWLPGQALDAYKGRCQRSWRERRSRSQQIPW